MWSIMVAALLAQGQALPAAEPRQPQSPPLDGADAQEISGEMLKTYFTSTDYPAEALKLKQQGRVRFEVVTSVEGRVKSCRIVESSGFASLDAQTCRVIQERMRFTPARDRKGQPAEDLLRGTLTWRL